MATERDDWSFGKFFLGFIKMKNAAKAIVMLWWIGIILTVCFSVYTVVHSRLTKPTPSQAVGTNTGTITTNNEDKRGNSFSLINLFNSR